MKVDSSPLTPTLTVEPAKRLNIGCGSNPFPKEDGWVNTDYKAADGVDDIFDANGPWPYPDETFIEVFSNHVLEHLHDYMNYFRETWRVLKPNGQMVIQVPYGWHQSAWWDLTHLRPWFQESFAGLQPGFRKFTRNLQHDDMGFAFWIHHVVMILGLPWSRMWRFPFLRPFVRFAIAHWINVIHGLSVAAVKVDSRDPRSSAYGGKFNPCIVPCQIGVMEHEYYGKIAPEDNHKLIVMSYKNGRAEIE